MNKEELAEQAEWKVKESEFWITAEDIQTHRNTKINIQTVINRQNMQTDINTHTHKYTDMQTHKQTYTQI